MLEEFTVSSHGYPHLINAGFARESRAYCLTGRPVCTLDDLKDALFKTTREAVVKLPIKQDEHAMLALTVTMVCPVFPTLGEGDEADHETQPDWYIEGENSTPNEQFGKKVRVYFIGQSDGIFWEPCIQTIRDVG